ncbi:MAG: DUF2973 domain-containing protein [Pseudanabaena sp. ELA607]|jgi:hypothetical protein
MVQILYIVAFAVLSILAVTNLIRSMISLSQNESRANHSKRERPIDKSRIHPELLDEDGNITSEPLLIIRSISVDDARSRLDALYNASPNSDPS